MEKKEIVIDGKTYILKEEVKTKTKFKVGDWVIADCGKIKDYTGRIINITGGYYKFNLNPFITSRGDYLDSDGSFDHIQRLATPKEIESHLISEAKRRGYTLNATYLSLIGDIFIHSGSYRYDFKSDILYAIGQGTGFVYDIYSKGKWAEIIKEEPIKIGGHEVELFDDYFKVGCMSFSKSDILKILTMHSFVLERGLSFTFNEDGKIEEHCNGIEFNDEVLQKILKKLKS